MRTIATSGGLAFGDNRCEIDVFAYGSRRGSTLRLADIVRPPDLLAVYTDSNDPHNREMRRTIRSMVGRDQRAIQRAILMADPAREILFRLRWPAKTTPTAALSQAAALERAQGVALPPWLLMALYGAARLCDRAPARAVEFISNFLARTIGSHEHGPQDSSAEADCIRPLPDLAIEQASASAIDAVLDGRDPQVPVEPLSCARTLFEISRRIWHPEHARPLRDRIARLDHPDFVGMALTNLGALWLWPCVSQPRLAGLALEERPFSPAAITNLWPVWLALLDASAEEARALLTPFSTREPTDALIEEPPDYTPPPVPDAALARAVARQLVEEAARNAAYAPQGVFDAALPADLPLTGWGVATMRLVALRPGRLWIALLDSRGQTIAVFPWSPDGERSEMRLVIPKWARPVVDLAAAALWRDLCVAGDEAAPVSHPAGDRPQHPAPRPIPPQADSRARPAVLPSSRRPLVGRIGQARVWGNAEERAIIRTRIAAAHAVRGHYRRHEYAGEGTDDPRRAAQIKALRQAAAARAGQFGLPAPPPGFTFVTPFMRGGTGQRAATEQHHPSPREVRAREVRAREVRARGLSALCGILQTS